MRDTPVFDLVRFCRNRRELEMWEQQGRPIPPPHIVKQRVVRQYAERFRLKILIESGTYLGAVVYAMRHRFDRIISIELSRALSECAQRRFARYPHITIVQGDSTVELPRLLAAIAEPCLFWLDAHFSGGITARGAIETPIVQELTHIMEHPIHGHVLLIDDAREFTGRNGYPGYEDLRAVIRHSRPGWVCTVENDIIRIHESVVAM